MPDNEPPIRGERAHLMLADEFTGWEAERAPYPPPPWSQPDGWWRGWAGVRPNRIVAPRYTEAARRLHMARVYTATAWRQLRNAARALTTGDTGDLW